MRGNPSPSWMNAIGAAFGVQREFFHHHIQEFLRQPIESAWDSPRLASERARKLRFPLTTRFHLNKPSKRTRDEDHVFSLRNKAEEKFGSYLKQVRLGANLFVGDPLLRRLSVHDGSNFSVEQNVSISCEHTDKGWFGEWNLQCLKSINLLLTPARSYRVARCRRRSREWTSWRLVLERNGPQSRQCRC